MNHLDKHAAGSSQFGKAPPLRLHPTAGEPSVNQAIARRALKDDGSCDDGVALDEPKRHEAAPAGAANTCEGLTRNLLVKGIGL